MKITDIRINGIKEPVGFTYETLTASWKTTEAAGKTQADAKIEVSLTEDFADVLFEKDGADLKSNGEELILTLTPRTRYFVKVSVTDETGDVAFGTTFFETGKMDEAWTAEWIAPKKGEEIHPILSKEFTVKKGVRSARLYATGVGLFEAYLNGEKIGDEYLTPYVNQYESGIQVITFPVELAEGTQKLELLLGKGWYMGVFGLDLQPNHAGSRMAAIAELHVTYEDGTEELISTDDTWTYTASDIEESGIYYGEDINRELWKSAGNEPRPVEVLLHPEQEEETRLLAKTSLIDRVSLPVLAKESVTVKEIITTPAGEIVLDFGQNFAGFVEFEADFPVGTTVKLEFAEILQEGNFYHQNYRDARSEFNYTSDGRRETVRPHFTFFGFRYVKVTGWPGELTADSMIGRVLYSDLTRTGYLETSDAKINRLYENTLWGLKSNFIDMPTDCPQRSERLGWTGDAQVFAPTASYHMDTRAFFHKFAKDLMAEQAYLDGGMPNFLPSPGHREQAGAVWGDIATFLPDTMYRFFGNADELRILYPMMKNWVDSITRRGVLTDGDKKFNFADTFGDWLALDGATPTSFKGSTDDDFVSSVYYFRSAQIVAQAAELLGNETDAAAYRKLAEHAKDVIHHEFFTPSGRLAVDTQAAYVVVLKFGLAIDRDVLIAGFKNRLKKDLYEIKCGFVGAPLLCTVLAEAGEYELAYDFLLKEGFPSWLYSVNLGATTIWERWNSVGEDGTISDTGMNSLNHYSYGSVMEFVYGYAAGIRPLTAGFTKAVIAPHPDVRLPRISCRYDSVSGEYAIQYSIEADGTFKAHIEIPFNCTAEVTLPEDPEGTRTLAAGSYDFAYPTTLRMPYSKDTKLSRIAKDPAALGILGAHTPVLAGIASSGNPEMCSNTLEEISHNTFLPFDPKELAVAIEEISKLTVTA